LDFVVFIVVDYLYRGELYSVLSQKECQYISICTERVSKKLTYKKIAKNHNCSVSTVEAGIRWGKANGFFVANDQELLNREIAELQAIVKELEAELKRLIDRSKELKKVEAKFLRGKNGGVYVNISFVSNYITGITKQLLDYRTRLMELRGLYKKTLNVELSGEIEINKKPSLKKLSDEELNQLEGITSKLFSRN